MSPAGKYRGLPLVDIHRFVEEAGVVEVEKVVREMREFVGQAAAGGGSAAYATVGGRSVVFGRWGAACDCDEALEILYAAHPGGWF